MPIMSSRRSAFVLGLTLMAAWVLLSVPLVSAVDPPSPPVALNPSTAKPAYPNAKTITICASGCTYTNPRLAFPIAGGNLLAAGDTIEIRPGTYDDPVMSCMYIIFDDITVVGILDANGKRPKLSGLCGGKAAIVSGGKRIKVSNLELAGVTCADGNCAGVRHDQAGGGLELVNLWIHDNQNGLLASAANDVITITDCLFENNGFNGALGMAHNLYIGTSAAVYFKNSISRNAKLGGHEFKSRAYYSEIDNSVIAGLDGTDSRLVDICDGGTIVIKNSVLEKGPNSQNTDMINYASESWNSAGSYVRNNAIFMSNNIGISDRSKSTFLLIMQDRNPSSHEIKGHTLVNLEKLYDGSTSLVVTGTLFKTTRALAGYAAYPDLPAPPAPGTAGIPSGSSGPTGPTTPTVALLTPPSPPAATNPGAPAPAYPSAKTVTVCASGCQYTSLYDAHAAAAAGDTIQIQPGSYGCLSIEKNDLTLVGVLDAAGNRPKLTGVCGRKGVLVTIGKRLTIKNLELYGASCTDGNCAGVRHDGAGGGLTLDNLFIRDNQNGILGSASGDVVTITNCIFDNNGFNDGSGMAHNLYMGRHAAVYFRNCVSRRATLGGHELKSRAYYTEIESSFLTSLDGVDSRLLDVPEGGIVVVRNSVLETGARTQNDDMIGWAAENYDTRQHEFYLQNNIVISDTPGTDIFLNVYSSRYPAKSQIANNRFIAVTKIVNDAAAATVTEQGSWVYASRDAAGYGAYPYIPPLPTGGTTTPTTPTYSWVASGFSACTTTCGGGIQTQTVTCRQDGTTTTVDDSKCASGTKPLTQQACNTAACTTTPTYSWFAGGFGSCTKSCGGGTQTQTVTCRQDGTTTTVDNSNCASGTKPLTQRACNTAACVTPTPTPATSTGPAGPKPTPSPSTSTGARSDEPTPTPTPSTPVPVGTAQRLRIKIARDITSENTASYTADFTRQTSSVLGLPQRRVVVESLTPGSTQVTFLILPPFSDETGASAQITAEAAANNFIDMWNAATSPLLTQPAMNDAVKSDALQAQAVTQCDDKTYSCQSASSSTGSPSKSITSQGWFIGVIILLVVLVLGLVAFALYKHHAKRSAPLKALSSAYGITDPYNHGGDVQMQHTSQPLSMYGTSQPAAAEPMFVPARPPRPAPPPPMPRREIPHHVA